MGKGDKKSRRGKIHIGSYGTRRPRKNSNSIPEKAVIKAKNKVAKPATTGVVKKAAKVIPVEEPVIVSAEPLIEATTEVIPQEVKEPETVKEKVAIKEANVEVTEEGKKAPRKTVKKPKEEVTPKAKK